MIDSNNPNEDIKQKLETLIQYFFKVNKKIHKMGDELKQSHKFKTFTTNYRSFQVHSFIIVEEMN